MERSSLIYKIEEKNWKDQVKYWKGKEEEGGVQEKHQIYHIIY